MKTSTVLTILAFAFLSLFTACQKDEDFTTEPTVGAKAFPKADKRLWDYLQRFEKEAALRGVSANLNATTISFDIAEIEQQYVAGSCAYAGNVGHHITIDKTFWTTTGSDYLKEMVVFHELGHCYLGRKHLETAFENRICKSIMRSGDGSCFDNYNASTRAYYLDELFSANAQ